MATKDTTVACPNCGKPASGRFCSHCGAALAKGECAACHAPLAKGARFCARCGAPAAGGPPRGTAASAPAAEAPAEKRGLADILPWAVAAIALIAVVVMLSGQRRQADQAATAVGMPPGTPLGQMGGGMGGGMGDAIAAMTPRERASRLFDRVMRYQEQGKQDSMMFFAPMAVQAYLMLDTMDLDARYDLGRIAEVTGSDSIALAQADTILAHEPTHLLGLALGAAASRGLNQEARARDYERRLLAAEPAERARNLPEYQGHATDLDSAIARAKRGS